MKTAKTLSTLLSLVSLILVLGILLLVFSSLNTSQPPLVRSRAADARTEAFMEAVCQPDYEAAGSLLLNQPDLTPQADPDSTLGKLLWDNFRASLSYEFTGPCQASGNGLERPVTVTGLDIAGIMHQLKDDAQSLLDQQALSSDPQQVYDASGGYQEAFVMDVLAHGAADILRTQQPQTTWDLTLKLEKRDGQWWILPDQALLDLLSGGIGG